MAQTKIGWRPYVSGTDTDALSFITAAGITNTTQQNAINTLVTDLKGYGIWSKMKALYPFVGGTAAQHRFNLKDPRTVNAAFYLDFIGGGNHSANGYQPNGTTAYADTKLTPNVMSQNSAHASFYSRTNITGTYFDILSQNSSTSFGILASYNGGGGTASYLYINTLSSDNVLNGSPSTGLYIGNRTASNITALFRNATKIITGNKTSLTPSTQNIYLGAGNDSGLATYFSPREQAFASIGDGLTDAEATAFYTAVQKYQTTLGRQVGTPIVADTDAQAFINAAVITDLTQANAVNTLVTDLKSANIWTKMKALYPFVGGTASQHKFNLKDPRDVDAAYRLVFNGGWTHSSTGVLPNGTTAYADTKLIPSTSLTLNSTHLSVYLTTAGGGGDYFDMGVEDNSYNNRLFTKVHGSGIQIMNNSYLIDYAETTFSNSTIVGHYINNRTSSNVINSFKNNTKILNDTAKISQGLSVRPLYIAAHNFAGSPSFLSPRRQAFASIGDGLTDTEAANFYTAVQKYQTTLGRAV